MEDQINVNISHSLPEGARVIHGQYPVLKTPLNLGANDGNEILPPVQCLLVPVPRTFRVSPLRGAGSTPLRLSSNYNILKAVAGIIQIVYGSLELYKAFQLRLTKFGYASYSLTIIPYMLMSLINLLATLCEPQYPTMFLVLYGGSDMPPVDHSVLPGTKASGAVASEIAPVADSRLARRDALNAHIGGAVGEAYGELQSMNPPSLSGVSTLPSGSGHTEWGLMKCSLRRGVDLSRFD